jgi:Icc-related predicted phosphoesterase
MKILAIGDFHGKFPPKLLKIAKGKDVDLILVTGDFNNTDEIRKLVFKNWSGKKWYDIIGLKKAAKLEKESFFSGLKILKKLNSIGKRSYIIWGNSDFYRDFTTSEPEEIMPGYYDDKIRKMGNVKSIERKKIKKAGLEILGHGGYVDATEFIKNPYTKDSKKIKRLIRRYKNDEKELFALFKKKPMNFVFLIHYTPYKIFDKVRFKGSPMNGKHVGFEPYNKIIKKYKPLLVICGHMHEYQGLKRIGNTAIVATGPAYKGKAAIIDIDENKKRVLNVKFIK